MIVYALIVRTSDGMALTASTDFNDEANKDIKEDKRYVKLLAKKALQFPDRCTLNLGMYSVHLVNGTGLSFLALCETSYPAVLAFSFLNELQKEFIVKYEKIRVNQARRPYTFIEFDNFIHMTRQRYNKPQSLTTRINLSDLSTEIKLRPPYIIQLSQVEPLNNGFQSINLTQLTVGPPSKLEPLPWYAIIVVFLCVGLASIGLYRGISSLAITSEDLDGPSSYHGFLFLFESVIQLIQVRLIMKQSKNRFVKSWTLLILVFVCSLFLWDLRDSWQIVFYLGTAIGMHLCINKRRLESKLPNYNV